MVKFLEGLSKCPRPLLEKIPQFGILSLVKTMEGRAVYGRVHARGSNHCSDVACESSLLLVLAGFLMSRFRFTYLSLLFLGILFLNPQFLCRRCLFACSSFLFALKVYLSTLRIESKTPLCLGVSLRIESTDKSILVCLDCSEEIHFLEKG